ncbi:MAG: hypothetical protein HYY46_01730 [Deltaproteobacteria bacterium]|nr:hypothetical protein [Deltaproteobacteria bacterium]
MLLLSLPSDLLQADTANSRGSPGIIFGSPNYAISIGGARNNELVVALIYLPETQELFFAYKNEGAYKNGKKIKASARDKLSQSMVA